MSSYFLSAIMLMIAASAIAVFTRIKQRENSGKQEEKIPSAYDFEIIDISE